MQQMRVQSGVTLDKYCTFVITGGGDKIAKQVHTCIPHVHCDIMPSLTDKPLVISGGPRQSTYQMHWLHMLGVSNRG